MGSRRKSFRAMNESEEYVPHPVPRAGVEKTGAGQTAVPKAPFTGKWEQITYWLMANPKGAARTLSGNSNVAPQTCLQRKALRRSGPHAYGSYLFSWLLDVLAGHGYKPGRTVIAYFSTILSEAIIGLTIEMSFIATFTQCYFGK
jgi:hypothetical protein